MARIPEEKLQKVADLVLQALAYPDIDLHYNIPQDDTEEPYFELIYKSDGIHAQKQKIPLKRVYWDKSPEDLAGLITFHIEQFMEEIDSVNYGAQ